MPDGAAWLGVLLLPALLLPVLLVVLVPRRWLGRAMLLWLLLPIFVYLGISALEIARQKPGEHALYNMVYGFMLISPLALPPWLIGNGLGFGLGFLLRRLRREPPAPSQPIGGYPHAVAPTQAARPTHAVRPVTPRPEPPPVGFAAPHAIGWRNVHLGFAHDGLVIGGQKVWEQPWRSVTLPSILLPHPAYPAQTHRHDIHEIGDPAAPVRFASSELSNAVWGFWVPKPPAGGPGSHSLDSPDGRLRAELEPLEFGNGHWRSAPRITDLAQGRVLLDLLGSDWDASIGFPAPNQVRLGLSSLRGARVSLLIDAARDRFWLLGEALRERPLAQIPDCLVEAEAAIQGRGAEPPVRRFAAWRSALVILFAALAAIAGATLLLPAPRRATEPPPLARVPTLNLAPDRR